MKILSSDLVEKCIMEAYKKYLVSQTGLFCITVNEETITFNCTIDKGNSLFNCGLTDNYYMKRDEIECLRKWCINNPNKDSESSKNWSFGFRYPEPKRHQNTVNITLIGRSSNMFNFHVNLSSTN